MEALESDHQRLKADGRTTSSLHISAGDLGAKSFRKRYNLKYAYLAGSMYRGISSKEMVVALGQAKLMGFLGTAALSLTQIEDDIKYIGSHLAKEQGFGVNLICHLSNPSIEMERVSLFLQLGIRCVEAAAFMLITPALVLFRTKGLRKGANGVICDNRIIAKVSRPEVAQAFLSPAPADIVQILFDEGKISAEQAQMAQKIPMSHDICVESDSGGHTDQGVASVLFPVIEQLRNEATRQFSGDEPIHVGLAGGIGTPNAVVSAFMMGADFVLTGSINQCTVESGASSAVKDLLEKINVQDTDYAPAGDMFEIGARVQVLKKGVLFPARANKLYQLYKHYDSWEGIPVSIQRQLEKNYFKKAFDQVWSEVIDYHMGKGQSVTIKEAENNQKHKMALVFRWYFAYANRLSFSGDLRFQTDFQVHTGPALGAFNQWVKNSDMAFWRNRNVDKVAEKLMEASAEKLTQQIKNILAR
ncbi:PfaD family polyunsaturated fatty acid/polyketide biosynthesis protein [Teredinibacter turnerae]|uniref:PfaD family polyunsaturated fatty acid/polyketide biosynthesis protein n=1 Tax=Teredinibacter turnerae TaxID=2426 RepID=UPI000A56CF86|nr:PfaD family polyunsaturated fatty acid/polyketide biosynthesis protein [Teredinibacter turnerae]